MKADANSAARALDGRRGLSSVLVAWRRFSLMLGLLALAACSGAPLSGNAVTIREIYDHPRTYVGNRAIVEGEVTNTMSLVLARYFTIDDGTGSINVITDKTLPRKGQRMRVAGKVSDFFSFGSENTLVLIEEEGQEGAPASQPSGAPGTRAAPSPGR